MKKLFFVALAVASFCLGFHLFDRMKPVQRPRGSPRPYSRGWE